MVLKEYSDFIFETITIFFVKIPQNKGRGERLTRRTKTPQKSPHFLLNLICNVYDVCLGYSLYKETTIIKKD
jgi:hypothetical protein